MFQVHKEKLPPYTEKDIGYKSINVTSLQVKSVDGTDTPNILKTFWQQSDVDLSSGMDFLPRGNIYAR